MMPMTEEEAAWRRSWLKKRGKDPGHGWNWLDAGAAYRDHLRDIRDSNRSDPPNPQDQRAGASPAPMNPAVGRTDDMEVK